MLPLKICAINSLETNPDAVREKVPQHYTYNQQGAIAHRYQTRRLDMSKTANIIGQYNDLEEQAIYDRIPDGWQLLHCDRRYAGFIRIFNGKGFFSGREVAVIPHPDYEFSNVLYAIKDAPMKYDSFSVYADLDSVSISVGYQDEETAQYVVDDIISVVTYDGMKVENLGKSIHITCDYERSRSRA